MLLFACTIVADPPPPFPTASTHLAVSPPPQGSVPSDRESAAGEVRPPEAAGFPKVGLSGACTLEQH